MRWHANFSSGCVLLCLDKMNIQVLRNTLRPMQIHRQASAYIFYTYIHVYIYIYVCIDTHVYEHALCLRVVCCCG